MPSRGASIYILMALPIDGQVGLPFDSHSLVSACPPKSRDAAPMTWLRTLPPLTAGAQPAPGRFPAGRWKRGHPPYIRQHRRGLIQRQDRGMPACSVVSQNGAYAVGTGLPRKSQRHAGQIPGTKKPTIRSVFSGSWCPEGDSKNSEFKGLECIVFRPHTWGHTRIFALCRPKLHHGNPSAPESMPRFQPVQSTPPPGA